MDNSIRTLFSVYQKLDYRDKENSGKKKLMGILTAYVFSSSVLSYNFYLAFDTPSFVILAFTSSLFIISLLVLTDFDNLFLGVRSSELLMTLPVKSSDIFVAKFLSAGAYLLFFILCAAVPHVIFFVLYGNGFTSAAMFIFTEILFCYFAAGILSLIYVFTLSFFKSKATIILNFLQVFFFIFVFYSSTLSSRIVSDSSGLFVKANIFSKPFVNYLPQKLFLLAQSDLFYFLLSLILTGLPFALMYIFISKKYYNILETVKAIGTGKKKKRKLNFNFVDDYINRYFLNNNYERGTFNLIRNELRSSRFLRLKYIPLIFMPVMFVLIGLLSEMPQMLVFNSEVNQTSFFKTSILVISPSITFTLLMCSRLLISNTKILDDNSLDTEWIYSSLPVQDNSFLIQGAVKYVYLYFVFPSAFLTAALLCIKADIVTILFNMAFILSGIFLINSIASLFDKVLPLTLSGGKFSSASKFIEIFFSIILGIILFLIQIFVFQNSIFVIIATFVFIIIPYLINRK